MRKYIGSIFIFICLLNFTSVGGAAQNSNAQREQEAAWEAALKSSDCRTCEDQLVRSSPDDAVHHYLIWSIELKTRGERERNIDMSSHLARSAR